MRELRQSTAVDVIIGPFVDPATGLPVTGADVDHGDVLLSKNGAATAAKNEATDNATHRAGGCYLCKLDATDTNTLHQLDLIVNISGDANTPMVVRETFMVIDADAWDAKYVLGEFAALGGVVSKGTMSAGGNTTSGTFPAGQRANVKIGDVLFVPSTGDRARIKTVNTSTGAWTIDAGETFGTDPSSLGYKVFVQPINLPLVAADLGDGLLTDVKFQTTPASIKAKTDKIPATATISGTVSAGAHTTTTIIASTATGYGNDLLNGRGLRFLTGPLAGLLVKITDYVSATGRIDFQNLLGLAAPTAPTNTDTFEIV